MNQKFSFKRIGLLLRRYFIENQNYEIYLWSILTIVFMIFRNGNSAGTILIVVGALYAVRFFKVFNYTPNGIQYLMVPATQVEKIISVLMLNTVYFVLMFSIVFSVGNLIGNLLEKIFYGLNNSVALQFFHSTSGFEFNFQGLKNIWISFGAFASIQAIFTLGSLYFKRNAVFKTLLSLFVVGVALGILEYIIFKITIGSFTETFNALNAADFVWNEAMLPETLTKTWKVFWKISGYLFIPFCWLVSYFRLTEKEI
jgi:hypothetical protein